MEAPQIIMTVILGMSLGMNLIKVKKVEDLIASLLSVGIFLTLLIWGGFFEYGC